jgi:hypothetical protein
MEPAGATAPAIHEGRNSDMTRITITCDDCGRRHRLERPVNAAGMIWIVCHDCELPLHAMFEQNATAAVATAPGAPEPALPSRDFQAAWESVLDVSSSGSLGS